MPPPPVVDGTYPAPVIERPRWTQRRVAHSWIIVVIASLLFAATIVGLFPLIYNFTLAALLDTATRVLEQR